jgi:hypothetical protein
LAVQPGQGAGNLGTGPSIDDVGNAWEEDATIKDFVARLAARRTQLDEAQNAISDLITGPESERQKKAKLIFAGLFKTLNHERSEVMQGIERYFRKQREFSDQIRSRNSPAPRASGSA